MSSARNDGAWGERLAERGLALDGAREAAQSFVEDPTVAAQDMAQGWLAGKAEDFFENNQQNFGSWKRRAKKALGMNTGGDNNSQTGRLEPTGVDFRQDWPFFIGILLALAKDGTDLVGIGSLPGIGWFISLFTGLLIAVCLYFAGGRGKNREWMRKVLRRLIVLLVGTVVETLLFGLNLLPIETVTVTAIYIWEIMGRKGLDPTKVGEKYLSKSTMDGLKRSSSE